jgi:hypothetical protein
MILLVILILIEYYNRNIIRFYLKLYYCLFKKKIYCHNERKNFYD